jgi:uncharacterized integral membrane protein
MIYLRFIWLGLVAAALLTVALANRGPVTVSLWPDTVTAFVGWGFAVTLPLFVWLLAALVVGLVLGLVWEWLRERDIRAEAARARRGVVAPPPAAQAQDDVLAILDQGKRQA